MTSVTNPGSNLDDEVVKCFHRLFYDLIAGAKSAVKRFDTTENIQFMRVRMKENEVLIIPGMKNISHVV